MIKINLNGNLFDSKASVFTIQNRGFKYGDAIFETIRIANGNICFLEKHIDRMLSSMKVLKMNIPAEYDTSFFASEIDKLIHENNIIGGGRVRITVFRDAEGYYTPSNNDVSFVIEAFILEGDDYQLNKNGLTVDLYEDEKVIINKLSSLKTNNCLTLVMAGIYKKENNLDECVMLNELGSVAECISSNLFAGFNGVLYTPSLNQGIIPGIMRSVVMDIAKANRIEVQETTLNAQVLLRADEVFLTNAIKGIQWVGAYRSKRYFSKTSRMLIDLLNANIKAKP
jgi:branched-subunit amino acid aminotransferase/4-amino-4-deoxychorismate lyase